MRYLFYGALGAALLISGCSSSVADNRNFERAAATLDSLYAGYSVAGVNLLRENYPFDEDYMATYLASEEQAAVPNAYSFLWPYSGTFSAVGALMESDMKYRKTLDVVVLPGLEEYFDSVRVPAAYSSYINSAPEADRFYDDNVWIGIDFTDIYGLTKDAHYLKKAEMVWRFIESGTDTLLGGGIYWCEQKKHSKNTCSNAPGAVYALKLHKATGNSKYLEQGKTLYDWTQSHLQDPEDMLYSDNISLDGRVDLTKFAYNSGQMMQAAALLYGITGENRYLTDAKVLAAACYDRFLHDFAPAGAASFRMPDKGNVWFTAVMFRGFAELYRIDGNRTYVDAFQRSLDWAWDHARDAQGLFSADWSGEEYDQSKWLLTQAAFVEMYARMASIRD